VKGLEYLVAISAAWVLSQLVKAVIRTHQRGKFRLSYLAESGGMPSVHSAFVVSFTTLAYLSEGISSTLFALSAVVSVVVIYDAMNVRYAVGEQGEAMNSLIREKKLKIPPIKVVRGHRPEEVVVGAGIGILVALVVFCTI
jgi:acid phosphatase family membrane protein YuiD